MKFTVTRKDDENALIGMEATQLENGAPYNLSFIVSDENAVMMRDAFNAAYPMEADDDWRKDGEWVEVSLKDAKPGDMAEFVCDFDGEAYHGTLSMGDDILVIRFEDFERAPAVSPWVVRRRNGNEGGKMTDLHIWRKLDPHRFDEPEKVGCYATQSGMMLYNDGQRPNWLLVEGRKWEDTPYVYWDGVRKHLDDSEFPLVKVTPEMMRKAVES